jgi:hypothetical protein
MADAPEPESSVKQLRPVGVVGDDEHEVVAVAARQLDSPGDQRPREAAAPSLGHCVDVLDLRGSPV